MSNGESPGDVIRARDVGAFDVWGLPSFDPWVETPEPQSEPEVVEELPAEVEEVPLDEVQPLTLEDLESIRQEAWNEGFAVGEKEGFHSTQLKVRQEAEVALSAKVGSLERLMSSLLAPLAEQDHQLEKAMVGLVEHMTRLVIQRELKTDSTHIAQVLRDGLKLLPMGADNIRLFINPQDFDQIKALRERHDASWRIVEDDSLQPGGCRIETEHSRVDASIETRVKLAMSQLFDQLHEQSVHPIGPDIDIDLDRPDAP